MGYISSSLCFTIFGAFPFSLNQSEINSLTKLDCAHHTKLDLLQWTHVNGKKKGYKQGSIFDLLSLDLESYNPFL